MQFGPTTHKWTEAFSPLDVLIGVRAYNGEDTFMTFNVHDNSRLNYTYRKTNLFCFCL